MFAELRVTYPDIDLEIVASSRVVDLARREADIAVRPESHPPEYLVGRRIGTTLSSAQMVAWTLLANSCVYWETDACARSVHSSHMVIRFAG
jgi:DNA-binding transcriptional LysR family regulator